MRKNLILFASNTGNTKKVAEELKRSFYRHGWESVLKEIPQDYDVKNPDFDFDDYDFLSVGSPVISELPLPRVREVLWSKWPGIHKVEVGPKCGIVFCTFGGAHLGMKEAEPTLKLLEVEVEHLSFKVIGSLAILGSMGGTESDVFHPESYFGDLRGRPNEEDMRTVARFVDDVMKKLEKESSLF